jgi:hypothetical protein
MDTAKTRTAAGITATILLILLIPAGLNYVPTLLAQTTETGEDTSSASQGEDTSSASQGEDTSSASQDYQEFQSCLSDAEVDGTVSEQQIRDCFAPIYNTGTGTTTDDTPTSTDSPPSDGGTGGADDTESGSGEENGGGAE